jgi:hypothetical protein
MHTHLEIPSQLYPSEHRQLLAKIPPKTRLLPHFCCRSSPCRGEKKYLNQGSTPQRKRAQKHQPHHPGISPLRTNKKWPRNIIVTSAQKVQESISWTTRIRNPSPWVCLLKSSIIAQTFLLSCCTLCDDWLDTLKPMKNVSMTFFVLRLCCILTLVCIPSR